MDWKIEVIIVPVKDIEQAKRFYSEQIGFVVDHDTVVSENYRMIQLTPPGSGCSIVVKTDNHGMTAGCIKGLQLVVTDVEQAREELLARGVAVSTIKHFEGTALVEGRGGRWNSFVFFSDPDGNEWLIQERPSGE